MTTTKGRPPLMQGGKGRTVYLPAHVWEWLKANGASQTITRLVEREIAKETK